MIGGKRCCGTGGWRNVCEKEWSGSRAILSEEK